MKQFVLAIFCALVSFSCGSMVVRANENLLDSFSSSSYTAEELRFLQLGLAFEGHYHGLLDGAWGRISEQAMRSFSKEVYDSSPTIGQAAALTLETAELVSREDWGFEYFSSLGLSFLIPRASFVESDHTETIINYEHGNSTLRYSFTVGSRERTQNLHDYAVKFHASHGEPYMVRKDGLAVTSSSDANGKILYVRSRIWQGSWSTLLLSAASNDRHLLGAVSSSISNQRNLHLSIPEHGLLRSSVDEVVKLIDAAQAPEKNGSGAGAKHSENRNAPGGTGSGFWVSQDGHVLTNAHVVEGCSRIRVNGAKASLVNLSEAFDLAVVLSEPNASFARFSSSPARLNEDVVVVGYPLSFILGGVNVTRGAISGVTGLAGDEVTMQISAPVQAGNSGGPVVSANGNVVGVVVSKLDSEAVQGAFGDVPQNINFAVRGEVAKLFLSLSGVSPTSGKDAVNMTPVELAEQVTGYTAFVQCD